MDMIGHYHKARACSAGLPQSICKKMNDNAFCAIFVKEPSPFVAGKCQKMGMDQEIKYLSLHERPRDF